MSGPLTEPLISILVPVYNAEETLRKALDAVFAQDLQEPFEVIIVNDGSTDRSPEILRDLQPPIPGVTILQKTNGGEASALNLAWSQARGRFIGILEADVIPQKDWLTLTLSQLTNNPSAMACGGLLQTPPDDTWIARLAGYEVERKQASWAHDVHHLTSANVLYRAQAWDIAGPFDEHLINSSFDAIFNARLRQHGHKLLFEPRAKVWHHYKSTLIGFLSRQYAYARYRVYFTKMTLYPADRRVAFQVLLSCLGFSTLLLALALAVSGLKTPPWLLTMLACGPLFSLLALLPETVSLWRDKRDPAVLLFPFVAMVRNLLAAFGTAIGLIHKRWGSHEKSPPLSSER